VLRWDDAGKLDPTFAADSVATLPDDVGGTALALTAHGEILVAGSRGFNLTVVRLTAEGALDEGFAGGRFTASFGTVANARAVIARGDGRLVVIGDDDSGNIAAPFGELVLIGLLSDGALDPDFGEAGIARFASQELERWSVAGALEAPNGELIVAATVDSDIVGSGMVHVVRFDHDGRNPASFAVTEGFALGIARQASGKLVLNAVTGGGVSSTAAAVLLRFDGDGRLDDEFGTGGIRVLTEKGAPGDAIAVDGDDRILLAGDLLARHRADGALDTSFGEYGVAPGLPPEGFRALALQPDGKIVAAGGICEHGAPPLVLCALGLVRYQADHVQSCGDADGDARFTVTDGVATLRRAAGLASVCPTAVCDVDGSGSVTVTDGVNVLRAAAELPVTLTCGMQP
jgi:uncharacterized delta-60 repeat protein